MTPPERQLITDLFQRMKGFGAPQKDSEAAALISDGVRSVPDAHYMLVQSVLAQEHALEVAGKRIEALERQLREAQGDKPASGSFLGGLPGSGRPGLEPAATSVPPIGSRAQPAGPDAPPDAGSRPRWTRQGLPAQGSPVQGSPAQAAGAEPASGGFMRQALATAAGVAGGMLAAGAIGSLLGTGTPAQAANAPPNSPANPAANPPASPEANTEAAVEQARQDWEDDVKADAEDTDWSDGGGFDMGGDI